MRRLAFALFVPLLAGLAWLSGPSAAQAESVLVLGAESYDGDTELATNLTGALRNATRQVSSWTLSDREVSLGQMMLVHGCEHPNQDCLGRIAEALQVDLLIYTEIRQIGGRSRVDVGLFSRADGAILSAVQDSLAEGVSDIDDLREPASRYIAEIGGATAGGDGEMGTVTIYSSGDGAEVFVDGASMGTISGDSVTLELAAGEHEITVGGDGFSSESESVTVEPNGTTELTLDVDEDDGGGDSLYATLSIAFLGVAVVATALTIASWAVLSNAGDVGALDLNEGDSDARMAFLAEANSPMSTLLNDENGQFSRDYCVGARLNRDTHESAAQAADGCDTGDTWNPIWVASFTTMLLASIGSAVFFGLHVSQDEEASSVSLLPSFGPDNAALDAVITF